MASTIIASTSPAAIVQTADGTGILSLQTGNTTAVTIDASQNVGIGTTSPGNLLHAYRNNTSQAAQVQIEQAGSGSPTLGFLKTGVYAWLIGQYGADNSFRIAASGADLNTSPRLTIDTSGNVLTGTTTASNSSGVGGKYLASATAPSYSLVGSSSSTDASYLLYSTGAAAYRFYVQYDGKIYATNTTITGISDIRLKENIRDLDEGLDTVLSLKPRKFDWKEGKGKDIKNDRGFIAQEFEEVLPDLIDEWKDTPPEGEKPYKSVRADLIPVLVKAIQEQQTIINDLKVRIETLEAK